DLAALDSQVTAVAGFPFTTTIKVPTNYFTGGVRYLMPFGSAVRPYLAGSAGVAHMRARRRPSSPPASTSPHGIFIKTDYLQLNGLSPHDHDCISTHRVYTGVGVTF